MLHRKRHGLCCTAYVKPSQDYKEKFDGEVELDETFVGSKNKNRHWNKKAKKCQGRVSKDKVL